jgi:hypothetical protein
MAIILAVLYFGLIELLMIESSRELADARRFRARVVAQTLAENGAELAAHQLVQKPIAVRVPASAEDADGTIQGELRRASETNFVLEGTGETKGLVKTKATVKVVGRLEGGTIYIDFTTHSP